MNRGEGGCDKGGRNGSSKSSFVSVLLPVLPVVLTKCPLEANLTMVSALSVKPTYFLAQHEKKCLKKLKDRAVRLCMALYGAIMKVCLVIYSIAGPKVWRKVAVASFKEKSILSSKDGLLAGV